MNNQRTQLRSNIQDGGYGDDTPIAAHVIRDGKIIVTMLVERLRSTEYRVRREDRQTGAVVSSLRTATLLGDLYLEAFAHGYDAGFEKGQNHARKVEHHLEDQPAPRPRRKGFPGRGNYRNFGVTASRDGGD